MASAPVLAMKLHVGQHVPRTWQLKIFQTSTFFAVSPRHLRRVHLQLVAWQSCRTLKGAALQEQMHQLLAMEHGCTWHKKEKSCLSTKRLLSTKNMISTFLISTKTMISTCLISTKNILEIKNQGLSSERAAMIEPFTAASMVLPCNAQQILHRWHLRLDVVENLGNMFSCLCPNTCYQDQFCFGTRYGEKL